MKTVSIFLASSSELTTDRDQFEIAVNRKNKILVGKGIFLRLEKWEDFLDKVSQTRLQDEYNKAIKESEIFVMLFFTKVGKYTEEEFDIAFGQFKQSNKPYIFTYFKDADVDEGIDLSSLKAFQEKLNNLGHFYTKYKNTEDLILKFNNQLDLLAAQNFIEFDNKGELRQVNLRIFKNELTELVDELSFSEAFAKIRNSSFIYEKTHLKNLELTFLHGNTDFHFSGRVKTFIDNIKEQNA